MPLRAPLRRPSPPRAFSHTSWVFSQVCFPSGSHTAQRAWVTSACLEQLSVSQASALLPLERLRVCVCAHACVRVCVCVRACHLVGKFAFRIFFALPTKTPPPVYRNT